MTTFDDDLIARLGQLNYIEFSRELARQTGPAAEVSETGGVMLHAASVDFPVLLNGVWRLDDRRPADEVVATADAWFTAKGRGYSLNTRDGWAADDDLRQAAASAGLDGFLHAPEMVCRSRLEDRSLPDGAELRWVTDPATFAGFVTVNDAAYASLGMPVGLVAEAFTDADLFTEPHVLSVVAYLQGEPVAAAQVLLSHGISGVYWVGTVEGARGRGLGEAVTRAVTNRAFDEGAGVVTLQASSMGEPIYLRMGYETLYRYTTYVRFEPSS